LPVPIDVLRNEAGLYSVGAKTVTQADPWVMTAVTGNDGKEAYVRRAVDVECGLVANSGEGERNTQLNTSSFSLGQLSGLGIVSANEIESSLFHAALRCGLSEIEARHTIRSGMTGGLAKPRDIPTVDDLNKPKKKGKATAAPHAAPAGNLIVRASEITPKKIEWLWPGRIQGSVGLARRSCCSISLHGSARVTNGLALVASVLSLVKSCSSLAKMIPRIRWCLD
jgi:hypothetical protein